MRHVCACDCVVLCCAVRSWALRCVTHVRLRSVLERVPARVAPSPHTRFRFVFCSGGDALRVAIFPAFPLVRSTHVGCHVVVYESASKKKEKKKKGEQARDQINKLLS
ncbi:hypothetical protein LY76DRAFT_161895 [Colletotrichum caudatum]|nr:hypothetical protein LY76DRAFT_161895 [Colletotrichum caudatum]